MDIVSIIKSDTSGNITKRLQGENNEEKYGAMKESNPVVAPETTTTGGNSKSEEHLLGVSEGKNKETVYKPSIHAVKDLLHDDNKKDALERSGSPSNVPQSVNGVSPAVRSSEKGDLKSKFKREEDLEKLESNIKAVPEGIKDYLTKEGDALGTDLAAFVNSPLQKLNALFSRRYTAFNTNIKLFGRYAWKQYSISDRDTSHPFVMLPWAEKLAFMENLSSDAAKFRKDKIDRFDKLVKDAMKSLGGKDDIPTPENGIKPQTRDSAKRFTGIQSSDYLKNSKVQPPENEIKPQTRNSANRFTGIQSSDYLKNSKVQPPEKDIQKGIQSSDYLKNSKVQPPENEIKPQTRNSANRFTGSQRSDYLKNSKVQPPEKDIQKGKGHSESEYKFDISNPSKFNERYINNNDKHLGPYFKGYADISLFEGRQDRFYDFEIYAPNSLRNKGLPDIPTAASGLKVDVNTNITSVKTISLVSGEEFDLGSFGSAARSLKLADNVASIQTSIYETEDIQVRKWMQNYIKYMYGDNPTPLVHRSYYQGYYYITYYYLDIDRSIIQERTFYGLPTFDLSLTPMDGDFKYFDVTWMIIGESPTREN